MLEANGESSMSNANGERKSVRYDPRWAVVLSCSLFTGMLIILKLVGILFADHKDWFGLLLEVLITVAGISLILWWNKRHNSYPRARLSAGMVRSPLAYALKVGALATLYMLLFGLSDFSNSSWPVSGNTRWIAIVVLMFLEGIWASVVTFIIIQYGLRAHTGPEISRQVDVPDQAGATG